MAQSVTKILIIRYSSMGDVILVAPLVAWLHTCYEKPEITLVTVKSYALLFQDNPLLFSVVGVVKGENADRVDLKSRWDMVIDLQNNRHSKKLIADLEYATLHRFDKMHFSRLQLLLFRVDRYRGERTIARRYIATVGTSPVPARLDFHLRFSATGERHFYKMMQHGEIDRPVIALFPFSAWKNKEWPETYYVSVGHFFLIKGWNVVILGGTDDRSRAARLCDRIGYRCISFAGQLDLYECGCVLSRCKLALGGDTGLTHLARACGVVCGYVFGPTTHHFGFQPEPDDKCIVFEKPHFCRPCHPHGGNFCFRLDHACMKTIRPDEVISGLLDIFHR